MSLILDALRKLERDKQPRDPSVVVVGHVAWGGRDPGRQLPRIVLGAAVVLALGLAGLWQLRPEPPSATRESPNAPAGTLTVPPLAAAPSATRALVPSASGSGDATTAPLPAPVAPPPPRAIDLPRPGSGPAASARAAEPGDGIARGATEGPIPAVPAPTVAAHSATPAGRDRSLRLTAISERDGRPVALLNDRLVREGDSFDGIRVVRIGPTEVEVEVDGRRRVIGF